MSLNIGRSSATESRTAPVQSSQGQTSPINDVQQASCPLHQMQGYGFSNVTFHGDFFVLPVDSEGILEDRSQQSLKCHSVAQRILIVPLTTSLVDESMSLRETS